MRRILAAVALATAALLPAPVAVAGQFDGKETPDIAIADWLNTKDGKPVSLKALRGQAVVVEFWATWCPPCKKSTPHLVETYKKHAKDGLTIVGIHSARGAEKTDEIAAFLKQYGMEYPIGRDMTGETGKAYGVTGIPHAFVLDPKGICLWEGNPLDTANFDAAVAKALVGAKAAAAITKREGATAALDPAWRSLERRDYKDAVERLKKLARSAKETTDREIAEAYLADIDAMAREDIARAEQLKNEKACADAAALLEQTSATYKGLDAAKEAETKLKEWNKDKAFKNEVEAQELLAKARELLQQGKNPEAQAVYKRIASKYKGTSAAEAAEQALAQF